MNKQIKSRQRVVEHSEVFTNEREVNAMLDLVKAETERIDSRFLEPACGEGNFLAEILRRKLEAVRKKYSRSKLDYERNAVAAACSIYGVELLADNVEACRRRMFEIWDREYTDVCKKEANDETREAVRFIFERNIQCGDALTMRTDKGEPIVFSEWSFITKNQVQRRDYIFEKLLNQEQSDGDQKTLSDVRDGGELLRRYVTDYRRVHRYE